jgi:pimeloyl-ACP methyl ester carboxylesterase
MLRAGSAAGAEARIIRNSRGDTMQPTVLRVAGADGVVLNASEWGGDQQRGMPCILLHGLGDACCVWDEVAVDLARHRRVIAFDLRGHGDSDWDPRGRYAVEDHLHDIEAALAHLHVGRCVVAGHSLGAAVALHLAAGHPDRVAGLGLIDYGPELSPRGMGYVHAALFETPARYETADLYEARLQARYPLGTAGSIRRLAAGTARPCPAGGVETKQDPAVLQRVRARAAENAANRAAHVERLWALLAQIACPTRVIRGELSSVLPRAAAVRMAQDVLQNGRLAVIPDAGHSVMIDNPDGLREALATFLAEIDAPSE